MMNLKSLFSFSVAFLCLAISLQAQIQEEQLNLSDLPSIKFYPPQLPNLSYKDMLYHKKPQPLGGHSLKFEFEASKSLGGLLEEATIEADGLSLPDGRTYKIRIYQPDEDEIAHMPIIKVGEEPLKELPKYQFKDWSKE